MTTPRAARALCPLLIFYALTVNPEAATAAEPSPNLTRHQRSLVALHDRTRAASMSSAQATRALGELSRLEREQPSPDRRTRALTDSLRQVLQVVEKSGIRDGVVVVQATTPSPSAKKLCERFDDARRRFEVARIEALHGKLEGPKRTFVEFLATAGVEVDGSQPWDMAVHSDALYRRVLSDPTLQMGVTYMDGLWDSRQLDEMMARALQRKARALLTMPGALMRTPALLTKAATVHAYRYLRDSLTNRQSRERAPTVAEKHYNAGNELYRRMLDPSMTYTSGIFDEGYSLEDAQFAKYDRLCRKLGLKEGDHVLDIGSGYGGFARHAARHHGARVTGVTNSSEHLKTARALSTELATVDFVYSDYRDIPHRFAPNTFDHVVSIEMIEAVGPKNLERFFAAASAPLKPGGLFALQAIASNGSKANCNAWFSKYIFHDGVAPSRKQVDAAASRCFGAPEDVERVTPHYDRTLMWWHGDFAAAWPDLRLDYSARFKRMWDFYTLSVAGGFRAGALQLDQVLFRNGGPRGVEKVRDFPSRARLDAARSTDRWKRRVAEVVADAEAERKARVQTRGGGAEDEGRRQTPPPKDARVCVVGGGPSGLTVAHALRGFSNVVVLEADQDVGGKSCTVDIDGRKHDAGATMGVRVKYRKVLALARQAGVPAGTFPREVHYDLVTGGRAARGKTGDLVRLVYQGLRYALHNTISGGLSGIERPNAELADPWPVLVKRRGIEALGSKMETYLTGYGYGDPETTPAVFGYRMLNLATLLGVARKRIIWPHGTRPIWQGLASKLDVRLGSRVERIERGGEGVKVYLAGSAEPQVFDDLFMAVDPKAASALLDATAEERDLFSRVKHSPYATFICRVEGMAEGRAEVGYLRENMRMDRQGHPMAWIKRYPDDNVFVIHLFAPKELSDGQILAKIRQDMGKLGATRVTLVKPNRWKFFPHVDSDSVRLDHFFHRADDLQGRNRTVFVNELLSMSTMADVVGYAQKLARRWADGKL